MREHVIDGADLRLGGRVVAAATSVTVREVDSIDGWVGVVDADLTAFAEQALVLHCSEQVAPCVVVLAGDRSLVRGGGDAPRTCGASSNRTSDLRKA